MKRAPISQLITEEALMTSADVDVYIVDETVLVPYKKNLFSICRSSSSLLNLEIAK